MLYLCVSARGSNGWHLEVHSTELCLSHAIILVYIFKKITQLNSVQPNPTQMPRAIAHSPTKKTPLLAPGVGGRQRKHPADPMSLPPMPSHTHTQTSFTCAAS